MDNKLDLIRGSLIGGAAGDALGYTVEFDDYSEIIANYGQPGITEYELVNGVAEISDDTQMTLFTANGLLMGLTRKYMRGFGRALECDVKFAYEDWYDTQMKSYEIVIKHYRDTWLSALPELYSCRAPGETCLTAIKEMKEGRTPQNDSKGCGGVMRVAPWSLLCACHEMRYGIEEIDVAGGEIARLTHKHPLGWIPSILLTHIIYRIVKDGDFKGLDKISSLEQFTTIVNEALQLLPNLVVKNNVSEVTWDQEKTIGEVFHNEVEYQRELIERALFLAGNESSDVDNISRLGEGWVGEETLAIAVYAVARHIDSFEDVLIASVNHDGDSDSTGAVAGNIIGAIVGYDAIPDKFKNNLELHDVILAIADDLHQGCIISEYDEVNTPEKLQWFSRYCEKQPAGFIDKNQSYFFLFDIEKYTMEQVRAFTLEECCKHCYDSDNYDMADLDYCYAEGIYNEYCNIPDYDDCDDEQPWVGYGLFLHTRLAPGDEFICYELTDIYDLDIQYEDDNYEVILNDGRTCFIHNDCFNDGWGGIEFEDETTINFEDIPTELLEELVQKTPLIRKVTLQQFEDDWYQQKAGCVAIRKCQ